MYFPDKLRGIQTYSYGIKHRAEQLINTYGIEKIKFSDKDIIIDCGANYGDLYAWTKLNNLNINYISFEPSPSEFKVEGFEPEILREANNALQIIEYIGVDGSPERGKNNETTIEYATEFLISKGFEIVFSNINQRYAKVLFRNKNF